MTSMEPDRGDFDLRGKRVWVAGHTGLVGSALVRALQREGCQLLLATHGQLDLARQADTEAWMRRARPEVVFIAAARVGGILANSRYPADFLYDNLMIGANIMRAAHEIGVEKLLWLGSSCIYPRDAPQPLTEDALLTGPLEATNEAYAIAKIAGLKLAEAYWRQHGDHFITVMPTNLYGANDNFDLETSHVLPALIRKVHEAKKAGWNSVTLWGTGTPRREFLHVDDFAAACVLIAKRYHEFQPINVGAGREITIRDLAGLIAGIVGFEGNFLFDQSRLDGSPRKLMDISRVVSLGWRPKTSLEDGIRDTYRRWLSTLSSVATALN